MSFLQKLIPFVTLLSALPALAQNGFVEGYVNGPDGKGIANAVVGFDHIDFGAHVETKTDKRGHYVFQSLVHGNYRVTVTIDGKIRDQLNSYFVSPGRQDMSSGNMPTLVFNLKTPEIFAASLKGVATKELSPEQAAAIAKARDEELQKQLARNDSFAAGKTAIETKKFDVAIEQLLKAAAADPKQEGIWSALADAYMGAGHEQRGAEAQKNYEKAGEAFGKAIDLAPKSAANYNNFAVALATTGKVDEARQQLAKAIELDPQGAATYHYNMGALLMNTSRSTDAIEEFRRATAVDPDFAEAYYYIGSVLAGSSTADAAGRMLPAAGTVDALRKYLSLAPNGPNAPAAKELLNALGAGADSKTKDAKGKPR